MPYLTLTRPGLCKRCGDPIPSGSRAFQKADGATACVPCCQKIAESKKHQETQDQINAAKAAKKKERYANMSPAKAAWYQAPQQTDVLSQARSPLKEQLEAAWADPSIQF